MRAAYSILHVDVNAPIHNFRAAADRTVLRTGCITVLERVYHAGSIIAPDVLHEAAVCSEAAVASSQASEPLRLHLPSVHAQRHQI